MTQIKFIQIPISKTIYFSIRLGNQDKLSYNPSSPAYRINKIPN